MTRALLAAALLMAGSACRAALHPTLSWDPELGVVLKTPSATVTWDSDGHRRGPRYRFGKGALERAPSRTAKALGPRHLRVSEVPEAGGSRVAVDRDIVLRVSQGGVELVETVTTTPPLPWLGPLAVSRTFAIALPGAERQDPLVVRPTAAGQAVAVHGLGGDALAYRIETRVNGGPTTGLALPLVHYEWSNGVSAAVCTDPFYNTTFSALREPYPPASLRGEVSGSSSVDAVPLSRPQTRTFALWLSSKPEPPAAGRYPSFERSMDAYFRMVLPHVAPGPAWLHDVAMVYYDYLSDEGKGWDRDVAALAKELTPAERQRVALCLHGWYDGLGSYCFDQAAQRMRDRWVAFGPSRKIPLTRAELARRLRTARSLGFRVLLYFGDGLLQDTLGPGYRADWNYRDPSGFSIGGWEGPDTFGHTQARNPADPAVRRWYRDYLRALLRTYGRCLDGFVWDETFYIRAGMLVTKPEPALASTAMMTLVAELRGIVKAADRNKVFMVSDCAGAVGTDVPPYALFADGTYQDTACRPNAWSYGLFPNWRNVLWSCNWNPITNFHWTRWGVDTFGAPVAISNGWGDDRGPSEWQPWERDGILRLFRERLARPPGPRYLTQDPGKLVAAGPEAPAPADTVAPVPPGWQNWALSAAGSTASASSEDDYGGGKWGPAGLIDGRHDTAGWGDGHGWASKRGEPLPQWAEVRFHAQRTVRRIVVYSYDDPKAKERAGKWGVIGFQVQARSPDGAWRPGVREERGMAMATFAYELAEPVRTDALRIVVTRVAPLDGQARLLQLEAWGPPG